MTVFKHSDERGNFRTIYEESKINIPIKQVSISKTFPGIIKAFHCHKLQTDIWYVVQGNIRAVTFTYGTNEENPEQTFLGEDYNDQILVIPPNTWHGYQVLGNKPATILYMLDQEYNPDDEERLSYNIFNWAVKNR